MAQCLESVYEITSSMAATFRVVSTPAFEREFRKTSRGKVELVAVLEELVAILSEDPQNRSGRHHVKKLAGLKPGEGQWRVRWREYRLRYDIFEREVVLHSFRHRKEAY
jgi:mRNA-degrading endonuclease RelE of RelBE toxin-antitoxin system